jgi:hypothetical protein
MHAVARPPAVYGIPVAFAGNTIAENNELFRFDNDGVDASTGLVRSSCSQCLPVFVVNPANDPYKNELLTVTPIPDELMQRKAVRDNVVHAMTQVRQHRKRNAPEIRPVVIPELDEMQTQLRTDGYISRTCGGDTLTGQQNQDNNEEATAVPESLVWDEQHARTDDEIALYMAMSATEDHQEALDDYGDDDDIQTGRVLRQERMTEHENTVQETLDYLDESIRGSISRFPNYLTDGTSGNLHEALIKICFSTESEIISDTAAYEPNGIRADRVIGRLDRPTEYPVGINIYSPHLRIALEKKTKPKLHQQMALLPHYVETWLSLHSLLPGVDMKPKAYNDACELYSEMNKVLENFITSLSRNDNKTVRMELVFASEDFHNHDLAWPSPADPSKFCDWFKVCKSSHMYNFVNAVKTASGLPLEYLLDKKRDNRNDDFSPEAKTAIMWHVENIVILLGQIGFRAPVHDYMDVDHPCETPIELVTVLSNSERQRTRLGYGLAPHCLQSDLRGHRILSRTQSQNSARNNTAKWFRADILSAVHVAKVYVEKVDAVDVILKKYVLHLGNPEVRRDHCDMITDPGVFQAIDYGRLGQLKKKARTALIDELAIVFLEMYDAVCIARLTVKLERKDCCYVVTEETLPRGMNDLSFANAGYYDGVRVETVVRLFLRSDTITNEQATQIATLGT